MPMIPLFVVGPLARSADDLELALEVLTTPGNMDESDNRPELLPPRRQLFKDYRVAVWFTDSFPAAEINADVLAMLQKTVGKLQNAGLDIDEAARPEIGLYEMNFIFGQIFTHLMTESLPLPEWLISKQKEIQAMWAGFFEDYDVLLAPVSPTVAFPHDHEGTILSRSLVVNGQEKPMLNNMTWTRMAVVSGLPATVAPIGLSDSGLPVGIQIIGARLEDRTTIAFARGLSGLVGGFKAPPGYEN
jgi:amidase